ncbi:ESSS subunit of NADH:ubiquinone oxidoreductase (Complex I) protein [Thalictrum thalictroides]|uniref:ESSS subunit of NADH:ubiquinone oxidoreductase (Complex I) protein n=1 Tax=Thalictrum thalictroides TaxID=46969 RepID=A0A7J6X690_THATH|nr:ESSS subunit of NADH:ubiquinone oxidoreductase (Complex I) protein [Thalictrum thalictroides]
MSTSKAIAAASGMLRNRLKSSIRMRGGGGGESRWSSPGHQEKPNGYLFNRTPPPPGQSRKWEDWELPCYVTSFLTIVILGVGLSAKPDFTIETWAHQKALERLEAQKKIALSNADFTTAEESA